MIRRFHIEDLVSQDDAGVLFRAIDVDCDKLVALRRFFPFGSDSGGLNGDEQTAYQVAVGRLSEISHPSLRPIVAGGCDPIDGMPFIATEWIPGRTLVERLEDGPLTAEEARRMLDQALEASEILSTVLAEPALWVDTSPSTVIVTEVDGQAVFNFWISPLKWLGEDAKTLSLRGLADLLEKSLKWKHRLVTDHAGNGLGGWLRWLKKHAASATLAQARETLANAGSGNTNAPAPRMASGGGPLAKTGKLQPEAPPQRAATIVNVQKNPAGRPPEEKSGGGKVVLALFLLFALLASAGGAWYFLLGPGRKITAERAAPADREESALPTLPPAPAK